MQSNDPNIVSIFHIYNNTIKPLLALVETYRQKYPIELLNELRYLFDHIARCYTSDANEVIRREQIKKTERHVYRTVMDCHKVIIVCCFERVRRFERQTKKIDIKTIDNGDFESKYTKMEAAARSAQKIAKLQENSNALSHEEKMELFDIAKSRYIELADFIDEKKKHIIWARVRYKTITLGSRIIKLIIWLLAVVVGIILPMIFSEQFQFISDWVKRLIAAWMSP